MDQNQIEIDANQFIANANKLRRNKNMANSQENAAACCMLSIWACVMLSLLTGAILCLVYGGIMVNDYGEYNGPQLDNIIEGTCAVTGKYTIGQTLIYNVTAKLEGNYYKLQIIEPQTTGNNIKTAPCWFDKTKKGTYEYGTWNYVDSSTNGWGIVLLIIGILLFCCGFMKCCCATIVSVSQMAG